MMKAHQETKRQTETIKEAELMAWLAIKTRLRGLTMGTVTRISGKLLTLMVYEFPDQPGNIRLSFYHPGTGALFLSTIGAGAVRVSLNIKAQHDEWTLGQRRRNILKTVRQKAKFAPFESIDNYIQEEMIVVRINDDSWPFAATVRISSLQKSQLITNKGLYLRCLGRDSGPALPIPSPSVFGKIPHPLRGYQCQQPAPADHQSLSWYVLASGQTQLKYPGLFSAREQNVESMATDDGISTSQKNSPARWEKEARYSGSRYSGSRYSGEECEKLTNKEEEKNSPPTRGIETNSVSTLQQSPRIRPRRECGCGIRCEWCGGVHHVHGTHGIFTMFSPSWMGTEGEFSLDWYVPKGFVLPPIGVVASGTTFTLCLALNDLGLVTHGTGLLQRAQEHSSKYDPPEAVTTQNSIQSLEDMSTLNNQLDSDMGTKVGAINEDSLHTSEEAWSAVARAVLDKCYWIPLRCQEGEMLERPIVSQLSQMAPAPIGGVRTDLKLAVGTCIYRRVMKVPAKNRESMLLLVVVSQWHDQLVFSCYDFISCSIREAKREDPDFDAALLQDFKDASRELRNIQLEVILADLVVTEGFEPG
ncbi:unnamed protein product, partial [Choristocarpus tenellus]